MDLCQTANGSLGIDSFLGMQVAGTPLVFKCIVYEAVAANVWKPLLVAGRTRQRVVIDLGERKVRSKRAGHFVLGKPSG